RFVLRLQEHFLDLHRQVLQNTVPALADHFNQRLTRRLQFGRWRLFLCEGANAESGQQEKTHRGLAHGALPFMPLTCDLRYSRRKLFTSSAAADLSSHWC